MICSDKKKGQMQQKRKKGFSALSSIKRKSEAKAKVIIT
jgi:hypothetical protein